uniref:Stereocilin 1 n=1 Tax=Acanthochromis polyacanthus TaxID=80966 RepID=A0A3Q1G914_9TELE
FNLNAYYELLNRLYTVFKPLLRERFIEDLPKTVVCILSDREDCGLEAELTKAVFLELGKPLLTFLSSLRSQTCTPLSTDEETSSFFSAYLRTGQSMTAALSSFQQLFLNLMSSLSLSENLMNVGGGIMDGAVKYGLKFMAMLLELPMDYIRIALQFGIRVPYLDEQGTDLKQLILSAPHRVAREASNLQQLACNYNSWLESSAVDPVLVSLCSDNERVEFVRQVCSNVLLMRKLLSDRMNSWMYGYCANSSADPGYMVSQFCVYQQWLLQPEVPLDHYLFEFCMNLDGPRLTQLICEHTGFLMILISNPDNWPLMPNCTSAPPPPPLPHEDTLQLESCRYSEWHDVMQVTTDLLSQCILFDQSGFTRDVCSNKTFLDSLLQNAENAWLEGHCDSSLQFAPPEPTPSFNIAGWCDYQAWGERQVDDSVVGLCWQHDQLAFQKNVCCKALVFENLLENPKNQWEYFNMQLSSLRPVLSAAHISTVRLILRYYSRIMDTLSDEYLSTMVSVLLKIHLEADVDLFSELVPLLTAASPADIQALPSLQNNINRETINENLGSMTLAQQQAFGLWYSKVLPPSEIIRGHQSLIRDTGNLIAYLPFQNFQHLSPAQLGNIACLAEPEDLLLYKNTEAFSVIRGSVINCTHQGLRLPSHLLSNLFLNSSELRAPSSLSAERLTELAPVLPALGVTFLQSLTTSQLLDVLPVLNSVSFSSAQAKAIFKEVLDRNPNLSKRDFRLGTLGQGVSCKFLQKQFKDDPSPSSVRDFLAFLRQQPGLLHTSLKNCVIKELKEFAFFSELLEDFGAELALSMVSTIKKFSTKMMDTLRKMIIEDSRHFLLLSRAKQQLLVDKIAQRMSLQDMYTGVFTEEEFRSLGIMAPFVKDEVFIRVDRNFFIENLDFLKELCYSSSKMEIMARILEEPAVFPVQNWNQTTLSQVDRFLFFLPTSKLQEISQVLMTVGRIEKVFMSHRQWESGDVGIHCLKENEKEKIFDQQEFVLQFFLGFLRAPMVPTCEILHTTAPSVWTPNSLMNMPSSAFSTCLELIGQDPFLTSYQREEVLKRVKEMYGPVSSFSQSLIFQLGVIVTKMSLEELGALRLTERRSIATMGAVSSWNERQLALLFSNVLNSSRKSPSQLDSSTLVAMGYIVCGATTAEIKSFNNVEFKAVLWLGRLRLSCLEEQLLALVQLLIHPLAFGDMSSWGTDVFIEIGVLADIAMSALVKEQVEGISPLAISMISPQKFNVTFDSKKIAMLSYNQAIAVTKDQLDRLSQVQKSALAVVMNPWEDQPVNFR